MIRTVQGATIAAGDTVSDQGTAAQLIALASPGSHVGTPTADFPIMYHGRTVNFRVGVPFIAEPLLYAELTGQPVTWSS